MVRPTKKDVKVNILGKDMASAAFRTVGKSGRALGRTLNRLSTSVAGVFSGVAIGAGVKKSLEAFAKQESAEQRLLQALENRGIATQKNIKDTREAAAALQRISVVGDETALTQHAIAISMGASVQKSIELTKASADLSAGLGISLDQAARQVTKTLGGYAGELAEIFPEVKQLTKEQLQQGQVIDLIAKKYDGFSKREASTFGGQMQQLGNAVGDLSEEVGRQLAPDLEKLAIAIRENLPGLTKFVTSISDGAVAVVTLANKISDVLQPVIDKSRIGFANLASSIDLTFDAARTGNFSGLSDRITQAFKLNAANIAAFQQTAAAAAQRGFEQIAAGADTTAGPIGAGAGANRRAVRALRNTATLSQSRFLTGAGGQDSFVEIEKRLLVENKQQTKEQREQTAFLRQILAKFNLINIPATQGLFGSTGGGF